MEGNEVKNIAETLAAIEQASVKERLTVRRAEDSGVNTHPMPFIVLRDKDGAERIEELASLYSYRPVRHMGTTQLFDDDSFIEHYKRFSAPRSMIYAVPTPLTFTAVYNEHADEPEHRDFRAVLSVKHSPEWQAWTGISGKKLEGNVQFAEFIEDNLPDILAPDASEFMQIALNMSRSDATHFGSAIRLSDGHTQFAYSSEVAGTSSVNGQTVKIPELFKIEIPVWAGTHQKRYEIDVRLKHRSGQNGKLVIWIELVRPHKVLEQAFLDAWQKIKEGTGATILYGNP